MSVDEREYTIGGHSLAVKMHFFTHPKLRLPCARVTGDVRLYHGHYIMKDGCWYSYYYKKFHDAPATLKHLLKTEYELYVAKSILD